MSTSTSSSIKYLLIQFFYIPLLPNPIHNRSAPEQLERQKALQQRDMASLAASRAAASLGVSEMLGNPLNFSGATRSASPAATTPATFKTVALFSKKKAAPKPKPSAVSPADVELAKWYGK
jgi:hypothetical protein